MAVFGVIDWKNHLRVLSLGAISQIKRDYQNCHIGFVWKDLQKLHMDPLSAPGRTKLSLFSLYGQRFPRYGPIFKIAIFGNETWNLMKVQKLHVGPLSTPVGSKLSLFSPYGQRFQRFWNLQYLGMKPGVWKKSARSSIWTLFRFTGRGLPVTAILTLISLIN